MKHVLSGLAIFLLLYIATSCKKTSFITTPDAFVTTSADTLRFDTVFTTTGSVTQSLRIFNQNDQKLRLSSVKLAGGNSSSFKINVDGSPGANFTDLEMEPNDSLYIFVSVTINPNAANQPFLVQDSILINYNGNEQKIQLEAFGQNAHFYRNKRITTDSAWNNDLPYVILGQLSVDSNVTLTIQKGCRVYCHADAPIIVNGTLKANGQADANDRVLFTGDRLDPGYQGLPGGWPGIYFTSSGKNSVLNYSIIRDAFQGIISSGHRGNAPKVTLNQCIIFNVTDAGIVSTASNVKAVNCLIANCGANISINSGGSYIFDQCTVASYSNIFITHKNPVLFISNADSLSNVFHLDASFRNCIFYGEGGLVDNEIFLDKQGSPSPQDYDVAFSNVLYKNLDEPSSASFSSPFNNVSPQFDSINVEKGYYDFHLKQGSPAVNSGKNLGIQIDLDGNSRGGPSGLPDLGCYEQ